MLLLTACSNRKRHEPELGLCARTLAPASLTMLGARWASALKKAKPVAPATDMYCGRNFVEAKAAAASSDCELAVVSAGLGIVRADEVIPGYSLTVASGAHDNVLAKVPPEVTAAQWFEDLAGRSPYHTPLADLTRKHDLILVALPGAYLDMLAADLIALPAAQRKKVRVITGASSAALPTPLREAVMPYDDRLDGPDSNRSGTKSDFAARAARHFVEVVLPSSPDGDAEAHAKAVARRLRTMRAQRMKVRRKLSDAEVLALFRTHWSATDGRTSRLLRLLRDKLGVACEQGRAAKLAMQVRGERAS